MTAATPGQRAHERYWRYAAEEFGADPDDGVPAPERWEALQGWQRRAWEAAAAQPQNGPAPGGDESPLVGHARRELELCGQYAEDPEYAESLIRAVQAFASFGHSGGSAMIAREQLHALLGFKTLSPLTSNPAEWEDCSAISGTPLWQNRRDPAVFSYDGGATWYSLDDGTPQDGTAPGLRAALEAMLADWREDALPHFADTHDEIVDHRAVTACADTLAAVLGEYPAAAQPQGAYLYHCKFDGPGGDEYGLFWRKEDADAAAAKRAGEGRAEVLGMAILGEDGKPQPAPEVRTCYCGMTAPAVPNVFPHDDCDGSVPAAELARRLARAEAEAAELRARAAACECGAAAGEGRP